MRGFDKGRDKGSWKDGNRAESFLQGNGFGAVGEVSQEGLFVEEEDGAVVEDFLTGVIVENKKHGLGAALFAEIVKEGLVLEGDDLGGRTQSVQDVSLGGLAFFKRRRGRGAPVIANAHLAVFADAAVEQREDDAEEDEEQAVFEDMHGWRIFEF